MTTTTELIFSSMVIIASLVVCFVVIGATVELISSPDNLQVFVDCSECHTNMNATENITACNACKEMWSNAYT